MKDPERIVYANPEFEKVSGQGSAELEGQPWRVLNGEAEGAHEGRKLGAAVAESGDFIGTFRIDRAGDTAVVVDAYSNIIEDDDGTPAFRLAALVDVTAHERAQREELDQQLREKDTLLREIQHRVKNNLQMITALIRLEARNTSGEQATTRFDRLAGRIESVQLLYQSLSEDVGRGGEVRSEEHTSELQSQFHLVCRLLLEKKKKKNA